MIRARHVKYIGLALLLLFFAAIVFIRAERPHETTLAKITACDNGLYREQPACFHSVLRDALQSEDGLVLMDDLLTLPGVHCHAAIHVLGQELMKKYGSVETSLMHCTQECSSACTHGVIGEAFAEVPDIKS